MPEPVMHKFAIEMPSVDGTYFLDIGQIASLCNRKFYRQGMNWAVGNIEIFSDGDTSTVISKLPSTWIMANSWVKSMAAWKEQQNEVLDDEPSIKAKYNDFKIFYDSDHEQLGFGSNLLPYGFSGSFGLDDSYDWDHTNIEIPTDGGALPPVRYNLHAIGAPTATSKGLINGYALSRARPQQEDPNVPLYGGWLQAISDVAEVDPYIRQNVIHENDSPPYPVAAADGVNQNQNFYPGAVNQASTYSSFIQDVLVTRSSTSLTADSSGPFLAPCGLLRFDLTVLGTPDEVVLFLELVPGPVKGLLAEPMQEMN
jgi:hypothetical protein